MTAPQIVWNQGYSSVFQSENSELKANEEFALCTQLMEDRLISEIPWQFFHIELFHMLFDNTTFCRLGAVT